MARYRMLTVPTPFRCWRCGARKRTRLWLISQWAPERGRMVRWLSAGCAGHRPPHRGNATPESYRAALMADFRRSHGLDLSDDDRANKIRTALGGRLHDEGDRVSERSESDYALTDAEWLAFQRLPEEGHSHRAWVDARIRERAARAVKDALAQLDGSAASRLSLATGLSAEEIEDLGGLSAPASPPDRPQRPH